MGKGLVQVIPEVATSRRVVLNDQLLQAIAEVCALSLNALSQDSVSVSQCVAQGLSYSSKLLLRQAAIFKQLPEYVSPEAGSAQGVSKAVLGIKGLHQRDHQGAGTQGGKPRLSHFFDDTLLLKVVFPALLVGALLSSHTLSVQLLTLEAQGIYAAAKVGS